MSEAQQIAPENNEQENITSLQKAYEATKEISKRADRSNEKGFLIKTFSVVAGLSLGTVGAQYILPAILVMNGGFALSAFVKRKDLTQLATIFQRETKDIDQSSRNYIKDIADELEKVEPLRLKDINPTAQWKDNKLGILYAAVLSFSAPKLGGIALSLMPGLSDTSRNIRLKIHSLEAKYELEKDHSLSVLVP